MSPELVCHGFPSMGGSVDVQIVGDEGGLSRIVERIFNEHESALSRFRADSELSALNATPATPFRATSLLFDAVSEAIAWACVTDGVFDPTRPPDDAQAPPQLPSAASGGSVAVLARPAIASGKWRHVQLDFERETITLPGDASIDLDGIGKGYTVDHAIAAIGPRANALVSASGDLYAAGDGPDGDGWYVGVQDPFAPARDVMMLNVNDRGVATAGSRPGVSRGDGNDGETDLAAVTVVALTATQADVLSRTALLLGSEAGLRLVERFDGAQCVAVTRFGGVLATRGLSEYLV
jgi:FAD:protein FMN transferase